MNELSVVKKHNNRIAEQRAYNGEALRLIKRTVAKDTTDDEFNMFIEICKRQGLDPFRRQIYALVYNKDNAQKRSVSFITGIDGYRAIAKRTGTFRPADNDPDIEYDENKICPDTNPKGIVKATVIVYQYAVDGWYPVVGSARWEEFAPIKEEKEWKNVLDKDGNQVMQTQGQYAGRPKRELVPTGVKSLNNENWKKMPHIMLAKCAEAQALRKGWPEEMSGLYVSEEMHKTEVESIATDEIEKFEKEKRLKAVGGKDAIPMILAQSEGLVMVPLGKIYDEVVALLKDFESAEEIEFWKERNRIGLQQYWGREPSDALELKAQIEKMIEERKNKCQEV